MGMVHRSQMGLPTMRLRKPMAVDRIHKRKGSWFGQLSGNIEMIAGCGRHVFSLYFMSLVGCTRVSGGEGWMVMRPSRGKLGRGNCGAGLVRQGEMCGGIDDGAVAPVDFRTQRGDVHCSMSHICAQEQQRHGRDAGG